MDLLHRNAVKDERLFFESGWLAARDYYRAQEPTMDLLTEWFVKMERCESHKDAERAARSLMATFDFDPSRQSRAQEPSEAEVGAAEEAVEALFDANGGAASTREEVVAALRAAQAARAEGEKA